MNLQKITEEEYQDIDFSTVQKLQGTFSKEVIEISSAYIQFIEENEVWIKNNKTTIPPKGAFLYSRAIHTAETLLSKNKKLNTTILTKENISSFFMYAQSFPEDNQPELGRFISALIQANYDRTKDYLAKKKEIYTLPCAYILKILPDKKIDNLLCFNNGPTVLVFGNAENAFCLSMLNGHVSLNGTAKSAGSFMKGGRICVKESEEVGTNMSGGVIRVNKAGIVGTNMYDGEIYINEEYKRITRFHGGKIYFKERLLRKEK